MFERLWPIALVVGSNVIYHICAKEVPSDIDPFASLTVAYAAAFVATLILFYAFRSASGSASLSEELRKTNWTPFVLGIVIVGLELGWILAYKAGWQVSEAYIIVTSIVSSALLIVGFLLYKEKITRNMVIGIALCLTGLIIINL